MQGTSQQGPLVAQLAPFAMAFAARSAAQSENDHLAVKDSKSAATKAGQGLLQHGSKRRCVRQVVKWLKGQTTRGPSLPDGASCARTRCAGSPSGT